MKKKLVLCNYLKVCALKRKIGEKKFKLLFGEATYKLQENLCHLKNKNKEKILLLLYLLSIITNTYTNVEIFHLFFQY